MDVLTKALKATESETSRLQTQVAELDAENADTRSRLVQSKAAADDAAAQCGVLQLQLETLRAEEEMAQSILSAKDAELDDVKHQLSLVRSRNDTLESRVREATAGD